MRPGRSATVALGALALALLAPAPGAVAGEWVAGDLHVHTTYSHDSYGGPGDDNTGIEEAYTAGHSVTSAFRLARSRGLDYLAITDHNDIRSQGDSGFGFGGVIAMPGYENSLMGHGQMLGARRIYDKGDSGAQAVTAMAAELRADGGLLQANHPSDPLWPYGYDVPVDAVEVWNLPWQYQPPLPSADDNEYALDYWEGWLDRGARVAATGGSDSHWVSTVAAQGPGQPTTWVYAEHRTTQGVLDGMRAGHTFVSHQPPAYGGPQAFLEADPDSDGFYELMAGDTAPAGAPLRVRVLGAPSALMRIVTDHGEQAFPPVRVTSPGFEHRFRLPEASTWARVEVYGEDRLAMLALTSAIYLRPDATGSPEP
jgi:hypothetical protein